MAFDGRIGRQGHHEVSRRINQLFTGGDADEDTETDLTGFLAGMHMAMVVGIDSLRAVALVIDKQFEFLIAIEPVPAAATTHFHRACHLEVRGAFRPELGQHFISIEEVDAFE